MKIKKLERVKSVPKKAQDYFKNFLKVLNKSLKQNGVGTVCDILVTDVERGYVHFNIEAWDTFKFTLRMKDMKPVKEGRDLNNPKMGWGLDQLVGRVFENLSDWDKYSNLCNSIDKKTQFIVMHNTVVTHDGDLGHGVYRVIFDRPIYKVGGKVSDRHFDVHELGPRYAVEYALKYVRDAVPVEVQYLGSHTDSISAKLLSETAQLKKQIMQLITNAEKSKSGMTLAGTDLILNLAEHAGFYNRKKFNG